MAARYSDEEMREILRRALESESDVDGIEHEDLVAAAVEVGIDPAAVEQAAIELRDEREAVGVVGAKQRKRRRRFVKSLATFAMVNSFLFAIDFITPGGPWFYWPLLGWGLLVALHGLRVLPPMSADTEREAVDTEMRRISRRRAKEARRLAKEAERQERKQGRNRQGGTESAFESAVEEGVTALLGALAGQLKRAASGRPPNRKPPSDFDHFVAHEKGSRRVPAADAPVAPSAPQARVVIDQAAAEVVEEELEAERAHKRRRS
jgi:hypothetical protein